MSDVTNLSSMLDTKLNLSGGTMTGGLTTTSLSATTISGGTLYSGSTDLYSIFSQVGHTHQFSAILNTAHTHSVSDVTNLSSLLDTKLNRIVTGKHGRKLKSVCLYNIRRIHCVGLYHNGTMSI